MAAYVAQAQPTSQRRAAQRPCSHSAQPEKTPTVRICEFKVKQMPAKQTLLDWLAKNEFKKVWLFVTLHGCAYAKN